MKQEKFTKLALEWAKENPDALIGSGRVKPISNYDLAHRLRFDVFSRDCYYFNDKSLEEILKEWNPCRKSKTKFKVKFDISKLQAVKTFNQNMKVFSVALWSGKELLKAFYIQDEDHWDCLTVLDQIIDINIHNYEDDKWRLVFHLDGIGGDRHYGIEVQDKYNKKDELK